MAKRKKTRITVTLELEAEGDALVAAARLRQQLKEQFPFINGSSCGPEGSYSIRCLGVRGVAEVIK